MVRLGNTVLKTATPGSQDGPPDFCIGVNGPKMDTHGQQWFSYLAYIASLSIIYQHVDVYLWVQTSCLDNKKW